MDKIIFKYRIISLCNGAVTWLYNSSTSWRSAFSGLIHHIACNYWDWCIIKVRVSQFHLFNTTNDKCITSPGCITYISYMINYHICKCKFMPIALFPPSFLFQINASHLALACNQPMPVTCSIRLFYTLRHKCRIRACCTAHTRSDYSDTSVARGVDALSECNNLQPTQTVSRWTGLLFLISFPPPATEQSSPSASGFVLCEMKCDDQLRWKFLRRFKMEFRGPSLPAEFFNLCTVHKDKWLPFMELP